MWKTSSGAVSRVKVFKFGIGMMADKMRKFKPEPDQVAVTIQGPDLKLCTI